MNTRTHKRTNIQTALITGASSGIGFELARVMAANEYNLVLVARSQDILDHLAAELSDKHKIKVLVISRDLAKPNAPEEIYSELQKNRIQIDILVNNAGFGNYGFFSQTSLEIDLDLIQVNIMALTHLTKLFLPYMIEKKRGRVLNVASVAAFMPGPYMNTYFASKAYVLQFSAALADELRRTGVTVSCLCPGPTVTNFGKRAHYQFKLKGRYQMSAQAVAKTAYKGMLKGKLVIIPGLLNKIMTVIPRFFSFSRMAVMVRKVSGY